MRFNSPASSKKGPIIARVQKTLREIQPSQKSAAWLAVTLGRKRDGHWIPPHTHIIYIYIIYIYIHPFLGWLKMFIVWKFCVCVLFWGFCGWWFAYIVVYPPTWTQMKFWRENVRNTIAAGDSTQATFVGPTVPLTHSETLIGRQDWILVVWCCFCWSQLLCLSRLPVQGFSSMQGSEKGGPSFNKDSEAWFSCREL